MKGRSHMHRCHIWVAPAVLLLALAALALALACVSTGAAKPQASAPEPAPAPAPAAKAAPGTGSTAPGAKPALEIVEGVTFSFGKFWPGNEPLKHTFVIKNTGAAEVKILRVQPG